MVYTMLTTLFLYYLWFFVKNSFERAKIAKKTEHVSLISWPDARPTNARLQGRLARMRRVVLRPLAFRAGVPVSLAITPQTATSARNRPG